MQSGKDELELSLLSAPFRKEDIEWRVQRSGVKGESAWVMLVAYIDNRAVQSRLDDVCGPAGWRNEYMRGPDGGVLAGISIKVDGEWVTKWDGAENTDIESVKGGLSDAMKRAAVQWGIGRYLYKLESKITSVRPSGDNWIAVKIDPKDSHSKKITGYWTAPALPAEFLPAPMVDSRSDKEKLLNLEPSQGDIDDPATAQQIKEAENLFLQAGGNSGIKREWVGAIKTRAQAEQAIHRLKKQIAARGKA